MRTRKTVLALAMVAMMVVAFAAPAMAANVDLKLPPDWQNNDNQQGWRTNGCDDETTTLEIASLQNATQLVIELSVAPDADRFDLVWQGDANDWSWEEHQLNPADYYADGKITLNLKDFKKKGKSVVECQDAGKFLIAFWNGEWANVTKAYLVTSSGGGSAPKTGDGMMIALALGVLAMAGCATVFVARKIKA